MQLRRSIAFLGVAGVVCLCLGSLLFPAFRAAADAHRRSSNFHRHTGQLVCGRRPPRPERHLAGARHGELGSPGSRGSPGPHPELTGAYGAGPAGQSIVEGGEIRTSRKHSRRRKATSRTG